MSSPFAITAAANTIPLDKDQKGQALFTVSNTTAKTLHSRAHIVSQPEVAASWLRLQGEAEHDIAASGSQQYSVLIAVPPGTQAGDYVFHLNVVNQANPDDDFSEGPAVKFSVAAPVPVEKKPFPWWIVAVAVGVVILLSGGIYGINRLLHPASAHVPTPTPTSVPVYCLQASTQALAITSIEAGADPTPQTVTLSNCGSAGNLTSTIKTSSGGAWLLPITPSTGTLSTGAKQDIAVAVTANPAGGVSLTAGSYTGTIIFTLGSRSVPVTVTFSVQPALVASPADLSVNKSFVGQTGVVITTLTNNSGAGTVSAEVSTDDGRNWLSINFANGTPIREGEMMTVPITATAIFNSGGYIGHVKFIIKTSKGTASVTVTVHLNITHF